MGFALRVIRVVILALLAAPLAIDAQPSGKPARLGILYGGSPAFSPETDPYDRGIVAGPSTARSRRPSGSRSRRPCSHGPTK
jgi:hypothetical protein